MIETLLTEIFESGWFVGLLRPANNKWEAHLLQPSEDPNYEYDLARWTDSSIEAALAGAFYQAECTKIQPKVKYKAARGIDILADLGLNKPINRRF